MMGSDNFGMHPIFKFRTEPTEEILTLLESVTLGTDGAHYRHLDTRERIQEADNPLFLSMERHQKVLGNVTFCKRHKNWYIRYFAFEGAHQAKGKKKSSSQGLLKRELNDFFEGRLNSGEVESFYAYIDPRNVKSLWMSENFGFKTTGKIATQTYSSIRKPKKGRVEIEKNPAEIPAEITSQFHHQRFFFEDQLKKGNHFAIRNEKGELIAFAKTTQANWEIKRLPGKMGGFLVKILPYVPFLNQLIRPKNHAFTVPEAVFIKDNEPQLFKELFDGILAHLNQRVIIWWVDEKDDLYGSIKSEVNWGLLHKVIGVSHANLVERTTTETNLGSRVTEPVEVSYTSGFDFI
jgi:archaeosine-15-forming tRNA-guanine transglycosylase